MIGTGTDEDPFRPNLPLGTTWNMEPHKNRKKAVVEVFCDEDKHQEIVVAGIVEYPDIKAARVAARG